MGLLGIDVYIIRIFEYIRISYANIRIPISAFVDIPIFYGTLANSIAPDVTPQFAASYLGLSCLLRGISSKNGIKYKNHSRAQQNERWLIQMIMMCKFTVLLIWVMGTFFWYGHSVTVTSAWSCRLYLAWSCRLYLCCNRHLCFRCHANRVATCWERASHLAHQTSCSNLSRDCVTRGNRSSGFPTRPHSNRAVQAQKMTSDWIVLDLESTGIVLSVALISFAVTAKLTCAFVFA